MTTDLDDDASTIRTGSPDDLASTDDGLEARFGRGARRERDAAHARLVRNRNTAVGFALLGALGFVAGLAVPDGRQVLFALAGVGGFAAILTYAMAPGRVLEARDGARVYETCAANVARLADELGGTADRRYVPADDDGADDDGADAVRLFVPRASGDAASGALEHGSGRRRLFLEPTGASFVGELERTLPDGLAGRPQPLAEQLTDALTDRFELVDRAEPLVDPEGGRVYVAVSDGAFGPVDRFDHPVASILAVGLATGLERPIDAAVTAETDRGEWLVRCRWERDDAREEGAE
ncbi:hypothetical protein [Natronococcus wangiae]|uniref:hypothetical protein n=1 Tax=Natronococcus wangiae TaxID=3068275 RepID=UPI00273E79D3|nr:hypothetical protein [Natronococcus sp. AD5]